MVFVLHILLPVQGKYDACMSFAVQDIGQILQTIVFFRWKKSGTVDSVYQWRIANEFRHLLWILFHICVDKHCDWIRIIIIVSPWRLSTKDALKHRLFFEVGNSLHATMWHGNVIIDCISKRTNRVGLYSSCTISFAYRSQLRIVRSSCF